MKSSHVLWFVVAVVAVATYFAVTRNKQTYEPQVIQNPVAQKEVVPFYPNNSGKE